MLVDEASIGYHPTIADPFPLSADPAIVGSLVSGVGAYISIRFLTKYFETRTLKPFAIYCMVAGICSLIFFGLTGR